MKKKTRQRLGGFAIAVLLVLLLPISTPACMDNGGIDIGKYNGAWVPTDDTVFAMTFDSDDGHAFIYDYGTPDAKLELFADAPYANIFFTEVITDGQSTWYADTVAGGQTLVLGENAQFGVSFSDVDETSFDYYLTGTSGAYALMDEDMDTALLIHDAEAVPIPGAALLLGSGLFGLAAARRRSSQV